MSKRIHLYGTALYDDLVGKYRMWYFGRMGPHWRVPDGNYQIPELYVPRPGQGRVHNCLEPVVKRSNEGTFNVTWDPVDGIYRAYSLQRFDDSEKRRVICYSESPSLAGPWKDAYPIWSRATGTTRSPGANTARCAPSSTTCPPSVMGVSTSVCWASSTWTAEQIPGEKNQIPCDGPIDGQFVYSRDGINWQHADRARTAALPRGAAFDRGMIIGTAKEPIIEGDEIHWYYTGCEHTHGEVDMEKRVKRLGRATWQRTASSRSPRPARV